MNMYRTCLVFCKCTPFGLARSSISYFFCGSFLLHLLQENEKVQIYYIRLAGKMQKGIPVLTFYCGQLWVRHMICGRTCDELYHFTFCTDPLLRVLFGESLVLDYTQTLALKLSVSAIIYPRWTATYIVLMSYIILSIDYLIKLNF